MSITGHFTGLLSEFKLHAQSQCAVSDASPKAKDTIYGYKNRKYNCKEVTLTDVLSIEMDIAPSTRLGACFPGKGSLRILVNPKEMYYSHRDEIKIIKTTTEVAYIYKDSSRSTPKLLLGLHYDYDVEETGDPGEGHPTYHAQITDQLFDLTPILQKQGVDLKTCSSVPFLRMPTAHMSLTSILIGIAADCFKNEDFEAFIRTIRKKPPFTLFHGDNLSDRIRKNGNSFASCSWYRNC